MFDLIVIMVLLVSALVGFLRGAVREVVTVAAFVAAALIAIFTLSLSGPLGRKLLDPDWLGSVVALVVVFVAVYIALRVIGSGLTRRIHDVEALGTADRVIGVGFGLIRALVVLGVFNLAFNIATPPERAPAWVVEARLYPLTDVAGQALRSVLQKGSAVFGTVTPTLEEAVIKGVEGDDAPQAPQDKAADKGADQGYDARARSKMDDLVEKTR